MLAQRDLRPELMDGSETPRSEHIRALQGLRRLNIASGVSRQIWRQIVKRCGLFSGQRLRVLDVACGGGDVALGLWKRAQRHGINIELIGLDRSLTACEEASQRCRSAGASILIRCTDVVASPLPTGFDVVTCSLFLHHLAREDAVSLLARMGDAGRLLVMSDLRRSIAGYLVAQAACRLATRSPIVHFDGPQSVANSFSIAEVAKLCGEAGLTGAVVRRAWPWRLMITRYRG